MTPRERIVLALDVPGEPEALAWASRMRGRVGLFKIGLQLFTAAGPELVSRIASEHGPVFLDLKYHDIPNTVSGAVRAAAGLGASMLTVHAAGGLAMLRAATEAAGSASRSSGAPPVRVLAVTVLTSLGPEDLAAGGVFRGARAQVLALAESAWLGGCDGFVASPHEVRALREKFGEAALLVIPGIRPSAPPGREGGAVPAQAGPQPTPWRRATDAAAARGGPARPTSPERGDDQVRSASPREALDAGADLLVIGRPILDAQDPEAALDAIVASMT